MKNTNTATVTFIHSIKDPSGKIKTKEIPCFIPFTQF